MKDNLAPLKEVGKKCYQFGAVTIEQVVHIHSERVYNMGSVPPPA